MQSSTVRLVGYVGALGLLGCDVTKPAPETLRSAKQGSDQCPPVRVYDTHGQLDDEEQWTEVTAAPASATDVRDLVIDNGFVRLTYEYLNDEQQGSHSLYLHQDGDLSRVTSSYYGDYTYWVTTVSEPAISAVVTRLAPELAEITYVFDHEPNMPWVTSMTLTKRVALQQCEPGMFVKFEGDPVNVPGEREFGIGQATRMSFSDFALGLHPTVGRHVNMGLLASTDAVWAAAIGEDAILRVLALTRPMATFSYQFSPPHLGRIVINQFIEGSDGADGYQAYLGAAGMATAGYAVLEFENSGGQVVDDPTATGGQYRYMHPGHVACFDFETPEGGEHTFWLRSRGYVPPEVRVTVGTESWMVLNRLNETFWQDKVGSAVLDPGVHTVCVSPQSTTLDADALIVIPTGAARSIAAGAISMMAN